MKNPWFLTSSFSDTNDKNKSRSVDLLLFLEMKRTLRCMKHEVAYGYEAFPAGTLEACVRFASCCATGAMLHTRRSLVLHICEANASFKRRKYEKR